MAERCDRCGRIAKTSEINRRFGDLLSTSLCVRCSGEWTNLWMSTYGRESFITRGDIKDYPIDSEDLWKQFMESLWEKVKFD